MKNFSLYCEAIAESARGWVELSASMIEKRPAVGYLGAAVPTASGFWVLIENLTKIGALLSITLGIAVALVTLHVQLLQRRKIKTELKNHDQNQRP